MPVGAAWCYAADRHLVPPIVPGRGRPWVWDVVPLSATCSTSRRGPLGRGTRARSQKPAGPRLRQRTCRACEIKADSHRLGLSSGSAEVGGPHAPTHCVLPCHMKGSRIGINASSGGRDGPTSVFGSSRSPYTRWLAARWSRRRSGAKTAATRPTVNREIKRVRGVCRIIPAAATTTTLRPMVQAVRVP